MRKKKYLLLLLLGLGLGSLASACESKLTYSEITSKEYLPSLDETTPAHPTQLCGGIPYKCSTFRVPASAKYHKAQYRFVLESCAGTIKRLVSFGVFQAYKKGDLYPHYMFCQSEKKPIQNRKKPTTDEIKI